MKGLDSDSSYRPLYAELHMPDAIFQAGFHDGDRPSVLSHSVEQMIVAQHEIHHDVALTETNFGFIQSTLRRLFESPRPPAIRQSIGEWLVYLLSKSRVTHEALATYLSIKQQPHAISASLVDGLPQEYKYYYNQLADIIDEVLPSTYLQFMVGKILIEICFSSNLISKMLSWKPEIPPHLDDEDLPDWRLDRLKPIWRNRLPEMRELLRRKCPQQEFYTGLVTFDIMSEEDWEMIPPRIGSQIDKWLDVECRDWMYAVASEAVPCARRAEWFTQRKNFLDYTNTFSTHPAYLSGDEFDFVNEDDQKWAERRADRRGRMTISNPDAKQIKLHKLDTASFMQLVFHSKQEQPKSAEPIRKWDSIFIVSPEPSPTLIEGDWAAFTYFSDECVDGYVVEKDSIIKLYKTLAQLAATGLAIPGRLRLIVGLWATDAGSIDTSLMNILIEAFSLPGLRFRFENPIWYMGGNFVAFYKSLVIKGGLECFFTNPFMPNADLPLVEPDQAADHLKTHLNDENTIFADIAKFCTQAALGPQWLIFKSPLVEGWFVRVSAPGAAIIVSIGEDIVAGKVRLLPRSEMDSAWNLISGAGSPIATRWSQF